MKTAKSITKKYGRRMDSCVRRIKNAGSALVSQTRAVKCHRRRHIDDDLFSTPFYIGVVHEICCLVLKYSFTVLTRILMCHETSEKVN